MQADLSDIVVSLNGRDAGKRFFVISCEGQYVYLADGRGRRLEAPKKKKRKHVRLVSAGGWLAQKLRDGEQVTNSELRRALGEAAPAHCGEPGGMFPWQKTT